MRTGHQAQHQLIEAVPFAVSRVIPSDSLGARPRAVPATEEAPRYTSHAMEEGAEMATSLAEISALLAGVEEGVAKEYLDRVQVRPFVGADAPLVVLARIRR